MNFLEKDLEQIIYESYLENPKDLKDKGLHLVGEMKRQLRIGNYGIADLVMIKRHYDLYGESKLFITVLELKKDKIGISAYLQGIEYMTGIKRYLNSRNFGFDVEYSLILIGKNLDDSGAFCFIPNFNENISFCTYSYGLDGLKFDFKFGYHLQNENFKL